MGRQPTRKCIGAAHLQVLYNDSTQGRVTSYEGFGLERYTSLRAHPANDGNVLQFLFHDRGVVSLASRSVHLILRRGLTQWHLSYAVRFYCP